VSPCPPVSRCPRVLCPGLLLCPRFSVSPVFPCPPGSPCKKYTKNQVLTAPTNSTNLRFELYVCELNYDRVYLECQPKFGQIIIAEVMASRRWLRCLTNKHVWLVEIALRSLRVMFIFSPLIITTLPPPAKLSNIQQLQKTVSDTHNMKHETTTCLWRKVSVLSCQDWLIIWCWKTLSWDCHGRVFQIKPWVENVYFKWNPVLKLGILNEMLSWNWVF